MKKPYTIPTVTVYELELDRNIAQIQTGSQTVRPEAYNKGSRSDIEPTSVDNLWGNNVS